MKNVGRFEITVGNSLQPWIDLKFDGGIHVDGGQTLSFTHDKLSDLKYAVDKAIRECKSKLPQNRWHEIE